MNVIYALIISLLAGLSTLLGGLIIFFNIKSENISKFITFSLAFSIAIMIGISIFDLMYESITHLLNVYQSNIFLYATILFLISYLIIKILTVFLKKYESSLYKLGILSMITLIVHNFPEGIITFLSSYADISLGIKYSLAIALHNIPEGIAIAVPIYYATSSKKKALLRAFLSGLSEPFGAFLAFLFLKDFVTYDILMLLLILVSGLMITLAIEQMLPEALKYKENKFIYLGFFAGIIVIMVNLML